MLNDINRVHAAVRGPLSHDISIACRRLAVSPCLKVSDRNLHASNNFLSHNQLFVSKLRFRDASVELHQACHCIQYGVTPKTLSGFHQASKLAFPTSVHDAANFRTDLIFHARQEREVVPLHHTNLPLQLHQPSTITKATSLATISSSTPSITLQRKIFTTISSAYVVTIVKKKT